MKNLKQSFSKKLLTSSLNEVQREEVRQILTDCLNGEAKKAKEKQINVEITSKDGSKETVKMTSAQNKVAYSKLKKLYKDLTPTEKKQVDELCKQFKDGLEIGHRVFKVIAND